MKEGERKRIDDSLTSAVRETIVPGSRLKATEQSVAHQLVAWTTIVSCLCSWNCNVRGDSYVTIRGGNWSWTKQRLTSWRRSIPSLVDVAGERGLAVELVSLVTEVGYNTLVGCGSI